MVFIYRDEVYYKTEEEWAREHADLDYPREMADIIVAKHRNGPIGQIKVRFKNSLTKFDNLSNAEPQLL